MHEQPDIGGDEPTPETRLRWDWAYVPVVILVVIWLGILGAYVALTR